MDRIKIHNGRIITPYRIIDNGSIIIEDGKIVCVSNGEIDAGSCTIIDARRNYVSPGFTDIHIHGGGGHDFMDGTVDAYIGVAEEHARHGTTSIVPTTLTSIKEELEHTFEVFKAARRENVKGAEMLGIHLEGPYFSLEQKGAQDARYIREPRPEEYKEVLDMSDDIIRWSTAPELKGAIKFGRYLTERGILPAVGHSNAVYDEVLEAFENGYRLVTHLYSCTSGVRRINAYRYAGVIESAFLIDEMSVEIVADGVHLPPSLLKLIYEIKGPSRIALVTDSMRAAGMPEGESVLGSLNNGQKVIVEDGVAKLKDMTAFAGSVATADRLIRTMVYDVNIPIVDVVRMMTTTPASIMGFDNHKGSLVPGKDADIIVFDENINIKMTVIKGKIVYNAQ